MLLAVADVALKRKGDAIVLAGGSTQQAGGGQAQPAAAQGRGQQAAGHRQHTQAGTQAAAKAKYLARYDDRHFVIPEYLYYFASSGDHVPLPRHARPPPLQLLFGQ